MSCTGATRAREMPLPAAMHLRYEVAACPACDETDDEQIASRDEIAREIEELWQFHLLRLRPGTPRRFLADRVVFSQDPPLRIGRCLNCGTLYRNPQERARELVGLYSSEKVDEAVLRGLFEAQRQSYRAQARRLTRFAGGAGSALEVGSYVGAFQSAARELGWAVEGVDVNTQAAGFARAAGFLVHDGEIAAVPEDREYDAIAIWNCYDQLPGPRRVVQAARQRLRPGGMLAIRVPNGAFYATMRQRLEGPLRGVARSLLAHNNLLGFPYRTGYTARSLGDLLRSEGLELITVVGDTLVPTADRWTRGWARWEERGVKTLISATMVGGRAPWIELYARA